MKKQSKHTCRTWGIVMTAIVLLGLGAGMVQAAPPRLPSLKISTRPLTPQDIKDYGLTNTTQVANGTHVVGLGQPVYLEVLVENPNPTASTPVLGIDAQLIWTLHNVVDEDGDSLTNSSTAAITDSPLTNLPSFDFGDQQGFYIAGRKMIVPDVKGTFEIGVEAVTTSNGTFNLDIDVVGSVFITKENFLCGVCHEDKMPDFNLTAHTTAFTRKISTDGGYFPERCTSCHVLGYDKTPGAVNGGFDDVAANVGWIHPAAPTTNSWNDMPAALKKVSNIQCENCHGPADEHMQTLGDTSKIGISLSAGNCGVCHDSLTHHYKVEEWEKTPHAQGYVFRASGSCAPCHSTKGFIDANDPGISEVGDIIATRGTGTEGITCAACHDPHSPGAGVHQLRNIGSVTLANGFEIEKGGDGLICMACHHDRNDANVRVLTSTPHYGTQTDMLFGKNAIEYGQNMPSSKHWDVVEDSCVQCHMQDTHGTVPEYAEHHVGGHSFMLSYDDGSNAVVHVTGTCAPCHGDITDFNFGGEDYDLDGVVEGVQKEVSDMLIELAMLLPPVGSETVTTSLYTANNVPYTAAQVTSFRRANYNRIFVTYDGSRGVHNPKYAAALLRSSIDDLKGGIDIDSDGLVDSWEIATFGNLTSQSGMDDYDGDGLTNLEEYNLGTNAKLKDSDGDGIWDLAEVQGHSNPLDINSVPDGDLVFLPAAEIGYMPKSDGTTVHFQSIETLIGGGWTNIGPAQTSSGGWLYQLENLRTNGTTRFYRATEE